MKLTLPLNLLAALMSFACAQDVAETPSVTNPSDGGFTNSGTNCNIYISQNVTWTKDHNYEEFGPATYLSVGSHAGPGCLSVENGSTVKVANCLNVGGKGYQYPVPEGESAQSNTGRVYVGPGATLEVGASEAQKDVAGSQLHVGAGAEGTVEVEAGTVITNYLLNVGYGATGTLEVSNKGNVEVRLPERMVDSFGGEGGASSSNFYIGSYGGTGTVNLNDSTLSVSAENGRFAQTYVGLQGSGTLNVLNGSKANLGDRTVMGYTSGANGNIRVDAATLLSGTTYVGYSGGHAELAADNGARVDVQGSLYVNDRVSVNGGALLTVTGGTELSGSLTISGGASVGLDSTLSTVYSGAIKVTGSTLGVAGQYWNDGELLLEKGASAKFGGDVYVSYDYADNRAHVSVSASGLEVAGTYSNIAGTLSLTDGATATIAAIDGGYLGGNGGGDVSVSGSDLNVTSFYSNLGTLNVTQGEKVAEDGTVTVSASHVKIAYDYTNYGTTNILLNRVAAEGETLVYEGASSVEVTGQYINHEGARTTIDLASGNSFSAGSYVDYGSTSITLAAGAVCHFGDLLMHGEGMTVTSSSPEAGEEAGKFILGNSGGSGGPSSSLFTVNASAEADAQVQASVLDVSSLNADIFEFDTTTEFTLQFMDDVLADVTSGSSKFLEILLIQGYEGFALDEAALQDMIGNTHYTFGSTTPRTVAYMGLSAQEEQQLDYAVRGASYSIRDNNLYWSGSVAAAETVPEPTTATLSLLALAGLAARRRRR